MNIYTFKGSKRIHQKVYRSGEYQKTPAKTLKAADKLHFAVFNAEKLGNLKAYHKRFGIIVNHDKLDNASYTLDSYSNINRFFEAIEKGNIIVNIGLGKDEYLVRSIIYELEADLINQIHELINCILQNRINYLNSRDAYIRSFCKSNLMAYQKEYDLLRIKLNKTIEVYVSNKKQHLIRIKDFLNDFINDPLFPFGTGKKKVARKPTMIHCCILTYDGEGETPKGYGFVNVDECIPEIDQSDLSNNVDSNAGKNYKLRLEGEGVGKTKGLSDQTKRLPIKISRKPLNR